MKTNKLITVTASVTVVIAILAGLYLSGSPAEQRLLRLDERRVSDLLQLTSAIGSYWDESGRLPMDLPMLVDGQRLRSLPVDPQTNVGYVYEVTGTDSYKLCAEFARASVDFTSEDFWSHQAGPHCFELHAVPL